MKILIAGLGIIGGSACMALKRAGYAVSGWNRSPAPLKYALENNIIDKAESDFSTYDLVFVALPPEATISFIAENNFKSGAIVSDMCGVKGYIEKGVLALGKDIRYVGCHPMAGKEVSGIRNACADLYDRASMIITHNTRSDPDAISAVRTVVKDMGFARIVECSAEVHDRKIAYTSQLAHIVSNAYVKDSELDNCLGFTGGSFQDMTRIAGVDERLWASLYLKNADCLIKNINCLISSLEDIKCAISSGEQDRLEEILREGRLLFEGGKKICRTDNISVTNLR